MTLEETMAHLRALVPDRAVPAFARLRGRIAWRRGAVREDARAQMRFLLEHARPDADLDRVARAYVDYQCRRGELRWHPDLITALRVEGEDHLRAARAQGRGVLVSFVHHGYYDGAWPSLGRLGLPAHIVVYPYMLQPDAPLWLRQHVAIGSRNGGQPVSASIGTQGLLGLLGAGEILGIAIDVPGRTPVRFAGRDVRGSFGAALLATQAGCPVVPLTSEEDDQGPLIRLHEPIDPAAYDEPRDLLAAMIALHERIVLRWPEATDLPLSRWGALDPGEPSTGETQAEHA